MTDGKTKAAFIVSRRIMGTNIGKEIVEQLLAFELPVFLNGTYQRIEYAETVEAGMTVMERNGKAATEIREIVNEIEELANGKD